MHHSRVGLAPRLLCAAVLGLLLGCDSSSTTPLQQKSPDAPPPPPPTPRAAVIHVSTYTPELYVGSTRQLTIVASDADGNPINTDRADVQLSDEGVAVVTESNTISHRNSNGTTTIEASPKLRMVGAGVVVARVTMDGVSDSVAMRVNDLVAGQFPLVVDSFRVVEYGLKCVSTCSSVAYAPLLRLREPTGRRDVAVVAVEFTMAGRSTGICEGWVDYAPGMTAELNGIDDYVWNNDLIFVNLDGSPIPGDSATGRVIVKVAENAYNELDVTGPVLRHVANLTLPPPRPNGWACR